MCASNYPPELDGQSCPNCGESLHLQQDETPDPDLVGQLRRLPAALPAAPGAKPPSRVREEGGLLWIDSDLLEELGYYGLESFKQVEIDGVAYELQGQKPSTGAWWVERVEA
jgi:hypothetical protein